MQQQKDYVTIGEISINKTILLVVNNLLNDSYDRIVKKFGPSIASDITSIKERNKIDYLKEMIQENLEDIKNHLLTQNASIVNKETNTSFLYTFPPRDIVSLTQEEFEITCRRIAFVLCSILPQVITQATLNNAFLEEEININTSNKNSDLTKSSNILSDDLFASSAEGKSRMFFSNSQNISEEDSIEDNEAVRCPAPFYKQAFQWKRFAEKNPSQNDKANINF